MIELVTIWAAFRLLRALAAISSSRPSPSSCSQAYAACASG